MAPKNKKETWFYAKFLKAVIHNFRAVNVDKHLSAASKVSTKKLIMFVKFIFLEILKVEKEGKIIANEYKIKNT